MQPWYLYKLYYTDDNYDDFESNKSLNSLACEVKNLFL